jgi:membrane-bound lytic murein transglycosylase F
MKTEYDDLIKRATKKHLPDGYDWRLYKCQLFKESTLNPLAKNSRTGAEGIAQFMPATWAEQRPRAGFSEAEVTDAEAAIFTGAYYMSELIEFWHWPRPIFDRYCLAMASYNAGPGNILKAQKLQGGSVYIADVLPVLHKVTEFHSIETINYIREITARWLNLATGGDNEEF